MDNAEELLKIQQDVQAQMGRNLLNYQGIEKLLKHIVKQSAIYVRKNLDGEFCVLQTKTERMMLGLLFGKFISDIVYIEENYTDNNSDDITSVSNETSLKINFTIQLSHPDQLAVLKSKTKQLVDDRNELVHHFRETYSLDSVESCKLALKHLNERNAFSREQIEYFNQTAIEFENTRASMAEVLARDEVIEFITAENNDTNPESLN
jgi:hypothetical protein